MPPKASACSTSRRARASPRSCLAATRKAAGGPAPRTCPASLAWARPASWPRSTWRTRTRGSNACATSWKSALLKSCPDSRVNGDVNNRLPNTTNISFEYVEGEAILLLLDRHGICASSGSACTSGSLEPSHVLRAMGVPFTAAHGSIRFSLSRYNTEDDVDFTIQKMPEIINRLRELSPFVQTVKR